MKNQRKASFASESATKMPKKWSWRSGAVEILQKYIIEEFKTKCEFHGVDFEANLSIMCSEVHRSMAADFPKDFPKDFGPDIVLEPGKEHKAINSEEYEFYQEEPNPKQLLDNHFGCFELSERAVVSLGAKFNNRDSPRDKTLHVNGGYLLSLIGGSPSLLSLIHI